MLPLLHFCVSVANIMKIIFVNHSQRTVAYFMQTLRPATDVAYELRFYDVPVAYLFCIHIREKSPCEIEPLKPVLNILKLRFEGSSKKSIMHVII